MLRYWPWLLLLFTGCGTGEIGSSEPSPNQRHTGSFEAATASCDIFMSVGTSGTVYPAAALVSLARANGARCIEVNPVPSNHADFHEVIAEGSEDALPRLIGQWLNEETSEQGY